MKFLNKLQHKNTTKSWISMRLRTGLLLLVGDKYWYSTCLVNQFTGSTFQLSRKAVLSKGHLFLKSVKKKILIDTEDQ